MRVEHWIYTIPLRLRSLFRRRDVEQELEEELQFHLRQQMETQMDKGASLEEARTAALRAMGGVAWRKEECRDTWRWNVMEDFARDLRHAGRALIKNAGFTSVVVLTLALAIGASASIFAVVYRVLLNPLPYANSDRLIDLRFSMPSQNIPELQMTTRLYYQYLDRARTLDGVALFQSEELTLTGQGAPERIRGSRATSTLASVLRVTPAKGRWFTEDDGVPGAVPVAVISQGLWSRRYSQDQSILGRTMSLDGVATTIVGVMPPSYTFPEPRVEFWVPLRLTRATAGDGYSGPGIARLRDGATLAGARAEMRRLNAELAPTYPGGAYDHLVSNATTLIESMTGRVSRTLWTLLASVGFLMLVACANIANLFLVRSEARQREVAVRRALGAGGRALTSYSLSESLLLSLAGGLIGLALARVALGLLVAYGLNGLPRLEEVRLDGVTIAFTLALSVLIALVLGLIPLLRRTPIGVSLRESGRGHTTSPGRHRARQLLMGAQIALALVLLLSSGLMLRSFQKLRAVDPGFDATSALTFRLGLPPGKYPDRATIVAGHRLIIDHLAALPGVTGVSATTCPPLTAACTPGAGLNVEGRVQAPPMVGFHAVAGGYFDVMGIRVVRGRGIDQGDVERNEPVAVINQALADMVFPNQDPIGKRVRFGNGSPRDPGWLTVSGVVANLPAQSLTELVRPPRLYMPMFSKRESLIAARRLGAMSYVVRTKLPPLSLTASVRDAIAEIDGTLAFAAVFTLEDILDRASAEMASTTVLLCIAAFVALMLGMIGIYGVTSHIVGQRTGEIGLRLALGGEPRAVAGMIVRQGGAVAVAGITLGLVAAFAGGRLIEALLFGISPHDPSIFTVMTLLLLGVALIACWLPARRATRISPLDALRRE